MPNPPLDWLLVGEPFVAYRARVDLLGLPEDEPQVRAPSRWVTLLAWRIMRRAGMNKA